MKKIVVTLLVIAAVLLTAVAIYYWVTPAGSLPHFVPGYEVGSSHKHLKHGLAAIILAIGCAILAWFSSGKKESTSAASTPKS